MKVTRAMVMAAGHGTRMRPLTNTRPKPLIRVGDRTLLDHTLDRLIEAGVAHAVVNVHYRAGQIGDKAGMPVICGGRPGLLPGGRS